MSKSKIKPSVSDYIKDLCRAFYLDLLDRGVEKGHANYVSRNFMRFLIEKEKALIKGEIDDWKQ